jgi:hypothetical protein
MNKERFWHKLKNLNKTNETIEADIEEIKNEFQKIFTTRNKINKTNETKLKKNLNKFIDETFRLIHDFKIDEKLIKDFINDLPHGKATGIHGVTNEMLKYAAVTELIYIIKIQFETMINYGIVPDNFNTSILKPLIKDSTKSTSDPLNLRPLAVSDVLSNLYEKILLFFVDLKYIDHQKQFGFKKNSSCSHAIFVLLQALHYAKIKKMRLYTIAIDFSKAFDKVNREYLWCKLIEYGIDIAIIRAIITYYAISEIIIQLGEKITTSFRSTVGVRQGGVLSPRLFAIFIHALIDLINEMELGVKIGKMVLDIIAYADDILIITNIKSNAQKMLNIIDIYCDEFEIKINADKTTLVIFNYSIKRPEKELRADTNQSDLKLQNCIISKSNEMKYIGVYFHENGKHDLHAQKRINSTIKSAAALNNFGLNDEILSPILRINMYKTYIMSILTYGYDIIIPNKQQLIKIKRTESNCIKNLLNISLYCKNTALLKACNIITLENRLFISQLALYKRLNENTYTIQLLNALDELQIKSDFIKRIEWLTSSYSNESTRYNKCDFEIDIIKLS